MTWQLLESIDGASPRVYLLMTISDTNQLAALRGKHSDEYGIEVLCLIDENVSVGVVQLRCAQCPQLKITVVTEGRSVVECNHARPNVLGKICYGCANLQPHIVVYRLSELRNMVDVDRIVSWM